MKLKNLTCVVLALVIVLAAPLSSFAAQTAQEKLQNVEQRRLALEGKYNIVIEYDQNADGSPCIGTGALSTLDMALERVTPAIVRQVSDYYLRRNGTLITFAFVYSPFQGIDPDIEILGSFDDETATVALYLPSSSKGVFSSGEGPLTMVHEFGHAVYVMLLELHGINRFNQEWIALNQGIPYTGAYLDTSFANQTFMSAYGATSLAEDFAEVFGHAFVRANAGQGFRSQLVKDGEKTPLGNKLDYLASILATYLNDTQAAIANLQKAYTTPAYMEYQGVRLGGQYMEFIDCHYPRYVLNGILSYLGLQAAESEWVREIGGWEVKDPYGNRVLIFPGGMYHILEIKSMAA